MNASNLISNTFKDQVDAFLSSINLKWNQEKTFCEGDVRVTFSSFNDSIKVHTQLAYEATAASEVHFSFSDISSDSPKLEMKQFNNDSYTRSNISSSDCLAHLTNRTLCMAYITEVARLILNNSENLISKYKALFLKKREDQQQLKKIKAERTKKEREEFVKEFKENYETATKLKAEIFVELVKERVKETKQEASFKVISLHPRYNEIVTEIYTVPYHEHALRIYNRKGNMLSMVKALAQFENSELIELT